MSTTTWDYVIIGGGIAGSVMASRLRQYDTSLNILLVEADSDTRAREDIVYANASPVGGDLDWQFKTEGVPAFQGREIVIAQGKGLGGSGEINMAVWVRGSAHDYDEWAEVVGDDRWTFKNQLPYMKMSEAWFDKENPDWHGFSGPIHVSSPKSTGRNYPLRDAVGKGWHALGIEALPSHDGLTGDNLGYAAANEARHEGKRQLPTVTYSMQGVTILVDSLVDKVLSEPDSSGLRATGVLLADGTEIKARSVISCAGAFQSPKLLMLSGIGAKEELKAHGIEVKSWFQDWDAMPECMRATDLDGGYLFLERCREPIIGLVRALLCEL